ncbi:MAG: transcriptional regulator [Clostridia bacterium]|nr:transcriptional regulator [Clostridia bacterium]
MEERFQTFTVLIAKISRSIRKIKSEEMEEYELKSPHVSCLYYLFKEESLTAKELCDICQEDKASISRSLEYLEERGFLICESNLKKRYKSLLKLTEKGKDIAKKIGDKIDAVLEIASKGLSDENRAILYQSLTLISNNLDLFCKKYGG